MIEKVNKYYDRFVGVIWLLVWFNFFMQYYLDSDFWEALAASSALILISYPFVSYLYNKKLPKALRTRRMKQFFFWFALFTVTACVSLIFTIRFLQYLEMTGFFKNGSLFTEFGPLWYQFINILLAIFFINFGFCGLRFFAENLLVRQELTESQVKILSEQINPHFMFNVMNHIHTLMQKDVPLASSLLLQYSDVLRYQLYNGREEFVDIGRETGFLKNYVEVEKLRWKGKLEVNTGWSVDNTDLKIRPLLFITFIENAFKHVYRPDKGKGFVNIDFRQCGEQVCLTVENSISRTVRPQNRESGIGLENARKRLEIFYPGRFTLQSGDDGIKYTTILKLDLPK